MPKWLKRLVVAGFVLALIGLGVLEVLRYQAERRGVVPVRLPSGTTMADLSRGADYTDAYRVPLRRPGVTPEAVLAAAQPLGRQVARVGHEAVYEGGAPGLRFVAGYLYEPGPDGGHLVLSTAVFYKSMLGRLYFMPVGVAHRRLVPFALSRMPEHLASTPP